MRKGVRGVMTDSLLAGRTVAAYLKLPDASHDWSHQWEVDYFTNGVMELTGTSPALPPVAEPARYTPRQLGLSISAMKFALAFHRGGTGGIGGLVFLI